MSDTKTPKSYEIENINDPSKPFQCIGYDDYKIMPGSLWRSIMTIVKGDIPEQDIYQENEDIRLLRKHGAVFVNDAFIPLWTIDQGLLFLYGGYGSSKTTYAITRLLVKCRNADYFKCFYGRQRKTEARELHDNIIREIERNGWDDEFQYSKAPNGSPDILHKASGNVFKMFGCDDDESLKGIDNPTDILIDEINQIDFSSFGMLITRLRTPGAKILLIACFNNCDVYPDHWIAKYIFNREEAKTQAEIVLLKALSALKISKHHSTYKDNMTQNWDYYLSTLVVKAAGDEEKINAYANGEWGVKLNSQPYYKKFNQEKHVTSLTYDPTKDLYFSFDENVNPYFPCLIGQLEHGKKFNVIAEIAARSPDNTVGYMCDTLIEMFPDHEAKIKITGDATSKKGDVKQEEGKNLYTIIHGGLQFSEETGKGFKNVEIITPESNPSNETRQLFLNSIFGLNYEELEIGIDENCPTIINDLQNCEEDPVKPGHKYKKREKVNGIQGVQRYGHFGDCLDYVICDVFQSEYALYQSGGQTTKVTGGSREVKNRMDAKPEIKKEEIEPENIKRFSYGKRYSRNRMS